LDIDTGAYHHKSGWLTGLDLSYRRVYQVNVFNHQVRILPLDEVVRPLKQQQIPPPKSALKPVFQQERKINL
jgi:serine/threonine protein phosphatase 1